MLTVFYGEQVWGTYPNSSAVRDALLDDLEVKNGCYIHWPNFEESTTWYRGDFTPWLLEDVPPELRMLILLLE